MDEGVNMAAVYTPLVRIVSRPYITRMRRSTKSERESNFEFAGARGRGHAPRGQSSAATSFETSLIRASKNVDASPDTAWRACAACSAPSARDCSFAANACVSARRQPLGRRIGPP